MSLPGPAIRNRTLNVGKSIPAGSVVARLHGSDGPALPVSLVELAQALGNTGQFVLPGTAPLVGINAGTGISVSVSGITYTVSLQTPVTLAHGGTGADLSATGGAHNFLKQSSSGAAITVGTIAAADLPSIPSGNLPADVAYVDVVQEWTAAQTFDSGKHILKGATSGTITLNAAAVAGTNTITIPAVTGTVITSADTGTVTNTMLANSSITIAGHSVSLGGTQAIAAADLSNGVTGSGAVVLATSPTIGTLTTTGTTTFPSSTVIDSSGRILQGLTTVFNAAGTAQQIQSVNAANTNSAAILTFQANTNGSGFTFGKSRGTATTAGAVASGDVIGFFQAVGDDGSTNAAMNVVGAQIVFLVSGTVSTGIVPTFIQFNTMNTGGTKAERLRIAPSGGVSNNATDPGAGNLTITGTGAFGTVTASSAGSNLGDQKHRVFASTAELDKTTDTALAAITGMSSITLQAGTYWIRGHLSTVSGASGGIKVAFSMNTAHIASASITAMGYNGTTLVANTTTTGTAIATSIFAQTAVITDINFEGVIVISAATAGISLQAAQNASNATTTKVLINSDMLLLQAGA